ncbi:hypothetical protein PCC8801_4165 [Rippkaea orientalis PCC 8801]|uniref:DUF5132 domain-containing protein n=1 Tax=Rippkaea orientalis (strain PCC 8801 / RF-1) TaxID=41431 RepID=B7K642_RIPO1|nr:DUF5132 domain-containing protein [Rippkaea orientalis]ACK68095.1 hypothetical protein PCC8801_4165 [Rippkaea orientalis PCC 8801]
MLQSLKTAYQNNPTRTIAIGLGVVVLTPVLIPLLKPLAKATVKTGVILYEKSKTTLAEVGEVLGDIVAEAKTEIIAEQAEKMGFLDSLPSESDN